MDDLVNAVKTCLSKYADFTGRAARPEYWWFFLFQVLLLAVVGMVSDMLYFVAAIGLLVPGLAAGARRLHDIGKSGWLQLLWIIPFVGWAVMIYFLVQPSQAGDNAYGPRALGAGAGELAPGQQ